MINLHEAKFVQIVYDFGGLPLLEILEYKSRKYFCLVNFIEDDSELLIFPLYIEDFPKELLPTEDTYYDYNN